MAKSTSLRARGLFMGFIIAFTVTGWVLYWSGKNAFDLAEQVSYLEPRSFETPTLIVVGSGGSTENPTRRGPALAIGYNDEVLLVDAGRAVAEGLRNARIPVQQPDTVYLTSLLPENTVGVDDLLLTGWRAPREKPLRLVGPPGTRALANALLEAHQAGIRAEQETLGYPEAGAQIDVVEIDGKWAEERSGLRVRALPLQNGPYPALAYRFDTSKTGIAISTAAWDRDALIAFARSARVLALQGYSERSLSQALESPDSSESDRAQLRREAASLPSLSEAGAIAKGARTYKLVLVRLRPPPIFDRPLLKEVRQHFQGILVLAEDGEEVTAGLAD